MVLQFHAAFSISVSSFFLFCFYFFEGAFYCIINKRSSRPFGLSHPRRPRGSQSGREKRRNERFQALAEEPLFTDSHQTISKQSSKYWLLIGHKTALYHCAQSSNSIS